MDIFLRSACENKVTIPVIRLGGELRRCFCLSRLSPGCWDESLRSPRDYAASATLTLAGRTRSYTASGTWEVRFAGDSPLEGDGFELVWGFSCQVVVLGCADSFLFGAGKAVFRPVACDQVRGARGRGQGTETLAKLGGLPPSVACVSQRLDA